MFGDLKNMASMAGLLRDLPRLKSRLEETKARLADVRVSAETGGGAVRVEASGELRICSIEVDPALLRGLVDPDDAADRALAADLIAGAVNAALERARAAAEQELSAAASELGLPIPPGGLGSLLQ